MSRKRRVPAHNHEKQEHYECVARLQYGPEIVADTNWMGGGRRPTETTQLTLRVVVAQRRIELGNPGKSGLKPLICEIIIGSVQYDYELRTHMKLGSFESFELPRLTGS